MKNTNLILAFSAGLLALALPSSAYAQCTSNADCKGARTCVNGRCTDAAAAPRACGRDTDCPGNQICTNAKCAAPGAASPKAPAPRPPAASPPATPPPATPRPAAPAVTAPVAPAAPGVRMTTVKKSITWLWVTGLIVFGVDYLAGIGITAGLACDDGRGSGIAVMAIPLLGPFIQLAANDCPAADDYVAPTVIAGVAQLLAATAFILGLSMSHNVLVPVYNVGSAELRVVPGPVGSSGWGLNVALTRF